MPVSDSTLFRVDTIRSGATFYMDADPKTLRVCSIAVGKLSVHINDEPEFIIGPHGMFKVKPGASCAMTNRLYIDSTLHTIVLQEG